MNRTPWWPSPVLVLGQLAAPLELCGWFCCVKVSPWGPDESWGPSGLDLPSVVPPLWSYWETFMSELFPNIWIKQERNKWQAGKKRERDEESEPGGRGQTEKTGMQRRRADTHAWLCEKMPSVSELEENYHHGNDFPDTSTLTSAVILERSVRDGCGGACLVPRRLVSTQLELPMHTHARTHTRTHLHSQPCANAFVGNFINVGPISSLIPYQLFYLFI